MEKFITGSFKRERGLQRGIDEMEDRHVEEIKRHFDVVAEGLSVDIRLLAEGYQSLNERMNGVEEELRKTRLVLGEKIDKVMIKAEDHEERIVTLEGSASV